MAPTPNTHDDRRQIQARKMVLISLMIALTGAMLGVVFGIILGDVTGPEAWVIGLVTFVTSTLLVAVTIKPVMATGVITAVLSVYFVFHLNVGAIFAYRESAEITLIVPYVTWFFPLVLFHQYTNFGFHKRPIGLLVSAGPLPIAAFVLATRDQSLAIGDLDAIVTFLVSFYAFVFFVGLYTRHRDDEILSAARAEEAERSAHALRVSEERFRLLSRAANDLVWDADLKSGQIWWNDTLLESYGYDPESYRADTSAWESWVHPDDRDRVVASLCKAVGSGASNWTSEYRFVCADGREVDVVARGLVIRDDLGEPVRMLGSTTDVTELRALERNLRHSQKMEAVGQLTGGVAHDFNNLLTVILGNAEILEDKLNELPHLKKLARMSLDAAERGAELTKRLLAFSRKQPLEPKILDVAKLVQGMDGLMRRTLPENIDIEIVRAGGLWKIEADAAQLESAVLNLAVNARDAMPEGGNLTIEMANAMLDDDYVAAEPDVRAGQYVVIVVTDTGHGIAPDLMSRVFDPFFTTKETGKGSGLGLSMVFGFVKQSGGHIRVYSEQGEGTSIKMYFPRSRREPEHPVTDSRVRRITGGTETVLVVEDDGAVREYVATQLKTLGYHVLQASTGAEATEVLNRNSEIDLLFTDMVMPGGMGGRELAETARMIRPGIRIVFTSGYTENSIVHHGRLDPGIKLLSKPYRRDQLAAAVREALADTGSND